MSDIFKKILVCYYQKKLVDFFNFYFYNFMCTDTKGVIVFGIYKYNLF